MGRRRWFNDLARDYRDLRTVQRVSASWDPKVTRMTCGVFFVLTVILYLILSSVMDKAEVEVTQTAEIKTETAVKQFLNATAGTPLPTATIPPKLLIRYESNGQCLIKGNINSKGDRIYHIPSSSSYASTKIDTSAGERWFCTEYEAIQAGWHAPGQ